MKQPDRAPADDTALAGLTTLWVRDAALALVLFAGTVAYLLAIPLHLASSNEAHHLHQAKRMLGSEVLYRDLVNLVTPGWLYLLAGCFRVFGTTLATARGVAAAVDGGIVVLIFLASRRSGVRPGLACTAAIAHLVVCRTAGPESSQHWLATFLSLLLLLLCLDPGRRAREVVSGIVVGLIIAVHQQRGLSMGLGAVAAIMAGALVARRAGASRVQAPLMTPLIGLAGGTMLVVLPMLGWLLLSAGFGPVWHALVFQPLVTYPKALSASWGQIGPTMARFALTFPRLLKYLPVVLALSALRLLVPRFRNPARTRIVTTLALFSIAAILSISYYPDFVHLGFIAPVLCVTLAESLEWMLHFLPAQARAGALVALVLLLASGWRLEQNLSNARGRPAATYRSAFGRVALYPGEVGLYETLDRLLSEVPGRTLYAHPISNYTYLITGARNPTRFEFVNAWYHSRQQVEEVLDVLRSTDIPYIVANPRLLNPKDPIAAFIQQHYELLSAGDLKLRHIWQRKEHFRSPSGAPG